MTQFTKRHEDFILFDTVNEIIVATRACNADDVTMEASLTETLGADSLDAVELQLALEDSLGVSIPDDALTQMKTVGDIVSYLEANH